MTTESDNVNHPKHYTSHVSGIECIEITRYMNFNLGNALKYWWRRNDKDNVIENMEKAIWYVKDEQKKRKNGWQFMDKTMLPALSAKLSLVTMHEAYPHNVIMELLVDTNFHRSTNISEVIEMMDIVLELEKAKQTRESVPSIGVDTDVRDVSEDAGGECLM